MVSLTRVLLFLSILFTGCAPIRPATDPLQDEYARRLAETAAQFNHDISAAKGTGWAKVVDQTQTMRYRIAWAAQWPNQMRITFILSGRPVETLVATGKSVTFISHTGRHSQYTMGNPDPDLDHILNLPVKISDICPVLLGRLPVRPYHDAYITPSYPEKEIIALFDRKKGPVQHLVFKPDNTLSELSTLDRQQNPAFTFRIDTMKRFNGRFIPERITFFSQTGDMVVFAITRFIPNPEIKPGVFELTAP